MKISKRVREEAAQICSAKASDWARFDASQISMHEYSDDEKAISLARAVFFDTTPARWDFCRERFVIEWGEAECLLRTGWSPK